MRTLLCLLWLLGGHLEAAPVTALAFSPDGAALVAAARGEVLVCSPATGEPLAHIPCEGMRIFSLAFHPDGTLLAVAGGVPGEMGQVRLLDWPGKRWLGSFSVNHDIITYVTFAPDGNRLATASADNTARIHALTDHGRNVTEQFALHGHTGPVQSVAFTPDGSMVVTVSVDRSVKVWSAANGKLLRSMGQHTDAVFALAFRPVPGTPPVCATAGDDRTVRIWQPAVGRMVRIVRGHESSILALAFAPDGKSLFSAGQEGIVRQIDADSDAVLNQWQASSDWIYHLVVSPDGRYLAAGDWAGHVAVRALH